ncbi:hypothetical protein PF011_g5400 [Phytophthora fragariae]|uniref:Uncharacterized protein n=1 Tax=Phytophthora fragariae TaxID=53985 RepID=A0A6A3LM58_9STRA|nr:hypothetical protein PF011_g5400 [Phytophthora fragariae]
MDKTCYYRIDEEKATESYVTDKCSTPDVVSGVMQLQLPGFDKKDSTESFVTDKCSTPDVVLCDKPPLISSKSVAKRN